MASKVYFADFHTTFEENLQRKLRRLMTRAGFKNMDLNGKFVALKVHFGEPGNLAYLRPNWTKTIVDFVKEQGGKPFATDANTLYVGRRKNALDHLEAAYENGYNPFAIGCHVIIADGLKGTDEALIPVEGGVYVKEAKIGRAVADADAVISITHFKAHEGSGMGGAIKNLGMGCGSRAGKCEMHSSGKTKVNESLCVGCGACARNCAHDAIKVIDGKARTFEDKCVGCSRCLGVCPTDAVYSPCDDSSEELCRKMAEYAKAVVQGKQHFHISFIVDVSPYCDCHSENDAPILPDIGMLASFDPVALDLACTELCNAAKLTENGCLKKQTSDHFGALHPTTNWREQITHGEKIGLGQASYELIKI